MKTSAFVLAALAAAATASAQPAVTLTPLGTVKSGPFRSDDPRVAEINAFDAAGKRIYVVNPFDGRVDVIDASNPAAPVQAAPVLLLSDCQTALDDDCPLRAGLEPNSVAIHGSLMVVAASNAPKTDNGHAILYRLRGTAAPEFLAAVEVGAGPDMVTFTDDGKYALTADEGEPDASYTVDPAGSVTIIDVGATVDACGRRGRERDHGRARDRREGRRPYDRVTRRVGFEKFDSAERREALVAAGVRVYGPNARVSQDLEPEYIATRHNKAYVTLQEANALAIINIEGAQVEAIVPLGLKDFSIAGTRLDASDQDGAANIRNWPVSGLYEPDGIAAFGARGRTYLIMANEGDAREYAGYVETVRLSNSGYLLDPVAFPDAAALKANAALGRLNVSTATGDLDHDGDFDRIDVLGGRSVSIRDQQGRLVWDSADMFEQLSKALDAGQVPGQFNLFNTTSTANSRDNRSDDKGVEPESVVVGEVNGRPYAFVALERDSGIVVLDLSDPTAPAFVTYVNNRRFPRNAADTAYLACSNTVDCGDLGPEGLTFVPARRSPIGTALLVVSNEASSTTTIWQIR